MNVLRSGPSHEVVTYAIIVAYALAMMATIPDGSAGLVPRIVLPLLLALAGFQLLSETVGPVHDLKQRVSARFQSAADDLSAEAEMEVEVDGEDTRTELATIAWIVGAFGIIYFSGIVLGSFVFATAYLAWNDHSLPLSVSLGVSIAGSMWMFSALLGIRIWSGILLLPEIPFL